MYSESEFMESRVTISIFRESKKTKVTEKFPNKKVLQSITPSADLSWEGDTYPGQGVLTLARGYVSWPGIPHPWMGGYPKVGTPRGVDRLKT